MHFAGSDINTISTKYENCDVDARMILLSWLKPSQRLLGHLQAPWHDLDGRPHTGTAA